MRPRRLRVRPATAAEAPSLREALKASVLTGLAGQAALIVSGVVVARMLGVENRGSLALLTVLPLLITLFGALGLPLALTYEIARAPSIALPLLQRLARFIAIQTLLLTLLHLTVLALIVRGRADDVRLAALLTTVAVPALIALQYGLAVLQGQQRYREFNALRLAPAALYAALAFALFAVGSGTLPLFAAGVTASWLAVGLATVVLTIKGSEPAQSTAVLPPTRRLVRFGVRGMLGSASPSDGAGVDQAVVGIFLSTRLLGLYVVAAAFMNLSRLVTQSIGLVAYPNVAARRDADDATRAMWRFTAVGAAAALAVTVTLELSVGRLIEILFGQSFAAADGVARVLLVAALLAGIRRVLSDAARGANRPLAGTVAEITSWAVLIGAMIVLTPLMELNGVALALVIASAVSLVVIVRSLRRAVGDPVEHVVPREARDALVP